MSEVVVEVEAVSVFYVLPPGTLIEDARLPAGQRLQGTPQLTLLWGRNGDTDHGYTTSIYIKFNWRNDVHFMNEPKCYLPQIRNEINVEER